MTDFSYLNVDNAYKLINQKVTKTPLVTNDYINNLLEAEIYFKLENLQNTGSFKLRGATHKITKLIETVKDSGVVAYSSGNHAQAVAYASMINTISAKIIMPKTAPQIKIENTKKYGAEVILYDTYFQSREEIGNEIQKKDNRALIKPYDDEDIIAGQGTAAIEIVNDLKEQSIEPDLYLCCCGGGGLIAGTSTYLKHIYPNIKSYSVEPEEFDDTKRSLEAGKLIENKKNAKSFCDALLAPQPGNITFQINSNNLEGGLSVSDEEVTKTIILLAEQLKIVVEPDEFDDTKRSLEAGKIIENKKNAKSFCDALLAPQPGNITFQINSNNLEGGLSVSDEEVTKTIILLAEQLKIVVEPGGAVAAAAVLNNKIDVKNKKIIVMISGGNIDLSLFNKL